MGMVAKNPQSNGNAKSAIRLRMMKIIQKSFFSLTANFFRPLTRALAFKFSLPTAYAVGYKFFRALRALEHYRSSSLT